MKLTELQYATVEANVGKEGWGYIRGFKIVLRGRE